MAQTLNILTLTATEAQGMLQVGKTTSVTLVEAYLAQIERHNHAGLHLNAMISITPTEIILETARRLDSERQAGHIRGKLHGIPFIVKDVFFTEPSLGLGTTAGSPCFATAKSKRTTPMIQHLLDQGMILLGKANMTEWCGLKMRGLTPGYSPMGGQTQSPYIFGGLEKDGTVLGHSSPGGSSSGSGAGVAAGFAPLSVGTECAGSLITPANRAGLYALKCGLGEVVDEGMFKYSDQIDCIGGMAKSAADLGDFIAAIMQRERPFDLSGGFEGLRVGFTDVKEYRLPEEYCSFSGDTREQMETGYASAIATLRQHGAVVEENVDLPNGLTAFKTDEGGSFFYDISFYLLRHKWLPAFFAELAESEVHSLEDVIRYNEEHKDICMPPEYPKQDELETLLATTGTPEKCRASVTELRRRGRAGLDKVLEKNDIVVAFADSGMVSFSSAAGYPVACVPLGVVKYSELNERPYGICMVAGKGREDLLLRFMAAFESAFPHRPLPRPLLQA